MAKRSRSETIAYFKELAWYFTTEAQKHAKDGDMGKMRYCKGKADAYDTAAFEVERNMV